MPASRPARPVRTRSHDVALRMLSSASHVRVRSEAPPDAGWSTDAAEMLELAGSRLGHDTWLARDGGTAITVATQFDPDVIVLDIGLPVINGVPSCDDCEQNARINHVHVAALNAWGQDEDRRTGRITTDPVAAGPLTDATNARFPMPLSTRFLLPRRPSPRLVRASLFALALVSGAAPSAAAQVPAEFTGDWVPAAALCTSPARIRVEAARVTLVNGADSQSFAGIEMAGPSFFGPDYKGIMAQAITEFDGDQPVQVTFNLQEKKGAAQAELASPVSGNVNAYGKALNARLATLNLVKRFPLHQVPLKKCPAGR